MSFVNLILHLAKCRDGLPSNMMAWLPVIKCLQIQLRAHQDAILGKKEQVGLASSFD